MNKYLIDDLSIIVLRYLPYPDLIKFKNTQYFNKGKHLFEELKIEQCTCFDKLCFSEKHRCICIDYYTNRKREYRSFSNSDRNCKATIHCICCQTLENIKKCNADLHNCLCRSQSAQISNCLAIEHDCSCVYLENCLHILCQNKTKINKMNDLLEISSI